MIIIMINTQGKVLCNFEPPGIVKGNNHFCYSEHNSYMLYFCLLSISLPYY